jgi:cytoskeletal protein RodZ
MDDKVKVNPTEARQGRKGTHVLAILVGALILAAIVWWAVDMFGQAIEPDEPTGGAPTEQPAEAPGGNTTVTE